MKALKNELELMVQQGYVNAIKNDDLTIYNYSSNAVFEKVWNEYTRMARGLVLNDEGRIIARPFIKFFNIGEHPETLPSALPASVPELAKKYDGSLICAFCNPHTNKWQAITRGCWDNEQTRMANKWLEEHGQKLHKAYTYLFELIAPWNRIVVNYDKERMILIGIINTENGYDYSYSEINKIGRVEGLETVEYEVKPISEVDLSVKGLNEEGYVARFSNGLRVKIKYKEYILLHKIFTGLTVKGIWELLSTNTPLDLSLVPKEFIEWHETKSGELKAQYSQLEKRAREAFASVPKLGTRKEYAEQFASKDKDLISILFNMLDNKPYENMIWKLLKPTVNPGETFQKADL